MSVDGGFERARSTLVGRARDLLRETDAVDAAVQQIDSQLWNRLSASFGTRVARTRRAARDLHREAEEGQADPQLIWAELHALRTDVDMLLDECLALVTGSAQRVVNLDGGFCSLADALVDELVARTPVAGWRSFTVLGRSELYSRASGVIQVRFPPSVWDLPVVAHELGHLLAPALAEDSGWRTVHPLEELFDTYGDGSDQSWSWLQELAADACAGHLLGPAYGFTCALVAFDPLLALVPTETHPAAQHRVELVAAVLASAGDESSGWASNRLLELWNNLVDAAGGREGRESLADHLFREPLIELLHEHLPISGYRTWSSAEAVADSLKDPRSGSGPDDGVLADILNGAWLARLRTDSISGVDIVGRAAMESCRRRIRKVG